MRLGPIAIAAAIFFCVAGGANAQNSLYREGWTLYAGGGLVYSPSYLGSDTYQISAVPYLQVRYGDRFFASVPRGVGYRVLYAESWSFGPHVKYDFGRDEDGDSPFMVYGDETDDLLGLGDIDGAVELGGFGEYRLGPLTATASIRQAVMGHEGMIGDLSLEYEAEYDSLGIPFIFLAETQMSFADSTYHDAYFSISEAQSLASGLPVFEAESGIVSFGAGVRGILPLKEHMAAMAIARFDRLTGDAADSPIVSERGTPNSAMIGLFLAYSL